MLKDNPNTERERERRYSSPWEREKRNFRTCAPQGGGIGIIGTKTLNEAKLMLGISALENRIEQIEERARSIIIPIQSLSPNQYEIIKPILAVVREDEGAFVATFFDANINSSGETQNEAVEMLKDSIASSFRVFQEQEAVLGDIPKRQFAVLQQFVRAK